MSDKNMKPLMIIALLGLIAGTWGIIDRLFYGHISMGYGSYIPWGLWVVFYLFFVGLTAGAFLITIMTYVFGVTKFERIGPLAAFTVLVALICELTFISLDLGHFFRLYRFLISPNFGSLMTWFVLFTTAMLVIYALELLFLLRGRPNDRSKVKTLSIISLPVGLLFYGTNGAFFAMVMNRPIWNSAITPVFFVLGALVSGGALLTSLIHLFQKDDEVVQILGRVTAFLLCSYVLIEVVRLIFGYLTGTPGIVTSLDIMAFGPNWWSFWLVQLLIGTFIPLYVIFSRPGNSSALAWACFLIVLSFIAVRFNFLMPDMVAFKREGLETAFSNRHLSTTYIPSLNEWLVSIWIISMGVLVFLAGARWLPVLSSGKGGAKHA